jgi:hypothetical protein
MGTFVTGAWIAFDVLICLRTGYMTAPFSWHEWVAWAGVGGSVAILALIAGHRDAKKHEREITDLNNRLSEQKDQLNEQKGISLGMASTLGRGLAHIESKVSDPISKAEISALREEIVQKPVIVYESFDERPFAWKSGEKPSYVHLWFRNEPTGGIARDAAAKISWWDARYTAQQPLFSVDGKWYEESPELGKRVQAENLIDLLPNRTAHGLDLFIRKPGEDWVYSLSSAAQPIDERHHLSLGIYKVRVTISCEGYSRDFWFRVVTGPAISVQEYVSPNGEGLEVRDELQR